MLASFELENDGNTKRFQQKCMCKPEQFDESCPVRRLCDVPGIKTVSAIKDNNARNFSIKINDNAIKKNFIQHDIVNVMDFVCKNCNNRER